MKNIYAFEEEESFEKFKDTIESFSERLKKYQFILEEYYALNDLPKGIVWTSEELATRVFSDIPLPAYTNENLIYITPDLSAWRKLFIKQLGDFKQSKIVNFYRNISENHLFTILAHELTHHSDLFLDEFDDDRADSIWFEEGMCDYLSRKITLGEKEFNEITNVEKNLVNFFKDKYGNHSLDNFGSESYYGSLSSIMFDYWRSFLTVKYLVEVRSNNDIRQVFDEYHNWDNKGRKIPLTEYFNLNLKTP
ncbi:hypothetical protein NC797_07880 [Aquibacillus sp. 3ASR75-11]|uniref:Uncharacterized protein n=1 Tax=Terrihalobacillus insolitus TaxID=2950438 RepID=A0A9X3WUU0_9BACI|nr:hypothetical protein [Terrihalobacillus insolitus]MDC3424426.1 hypothetical protein [Terrihalobacillus insolitus]